MKENHEQLHETNNKTALLSINKNLHNTKLLTSDRLYDCNELLNLVLSDRWLTRLRVKTRD